MIWHDVYYYISQHNIPNDLCDQHRVPILLVQEGLSDGDVEAAVQKLNSTAGSSAAKRSSNLPRSQLHSLKLQHIAPENT